MNDQTSTASNPKTHSCLKPPPLLGTGQTWQFGHLSGAAVALTLCQLAAQRNAPLLVITTDIQTGFQLHRDLDFFNTTALEVLHLPDREVLPYDRFSPHEDITSQRLETLYRIGHLKKGILIVSAATLMHYLPPVPFLQSHTLLLSQKQTLDLPAFKLQLANGGYRAVSQVTTHGEFSIRGSIIDLFPMGADTPYRIDLFDEEIDSIRSFDIDTQRSKETIASLRLLPAHEYPLTDAGIDFFRAAYRTRFPGNPLESELYQSVSRGIPIAGLEFYLPLFFEKLSTLFDYLPTSTLLVHHAPLDAASQQFQQEVQHRYNELSHDVEFPLCKPSELFLATDKLFKALHGFNQLKLFEKTVEEKPGRYNFSTSPLTQISAPKAFFETFPGTLLMIAESAGRREVLQSLLKESNLQPDYVDSWAQFLAIQPEARKKVTLLIGALESGVILDDLRVAIVTEGHLFADFVMQRRQRKTRVQDPDQIIKSLLELKVGDAVVHIDHGIGRYLGLQKIAVGNVDAEYMTLEYAEGAKIYVPIHALHLISRYGGNNQESAPLHRLGTKQWEKDKEKALKQASDTAAELLDVYSRRQASAGFAFPPPDETYRKFCNEFPFEPTPDQTKAIQAVINDMSSMHPMDRLVCGDVGFGKTEVAIRAAFLAVQGHKQVAVLVPTTLLATQHYNSFVDRFANWPIKIALFSRFVDAETVKQNLQALANGTVDIVIGTHKLLSKEIQFHDLGLLVVDEEHRFGVIHKEKIKNLKANVDILTLTATPIPRTLNLALSGTRDISIIATPPAKRLAIKTFILESNENRIRESILREIMRGGQAYFLHNEVKTIVNTTERLQALVPEAKVRFAHGQMRERDLERIMIDFYHQRFNVLVASTIIESGIDVPTANTIIIDRADHFGLSQLHQLRGRVGRSHHQAYAYLLTPPWKALTSDSKKRLEAIEALGELGSGFQLATYDLEIRGAGELLGDEQSGHIQTIGFSLFLEMIEQAVEAIKSGKQPEFKIVQQHRPDVELKLSALLSEKKINDIHLRLQLYKRLSACNTQIDIDEFKAEMIDRFGPLEIAEQQLFDIEQIKRRCQTMGIKKIEYAKTYLYVDLDTAPKINSAKLIKLLQIKPNQYKLQGPQRLRYQMAKEDPLMRISEVEQLLNTLCAP